MIERELAEGDDGQGKLVAEDPSDLLQSAAAEVAGWEDDGMRLLTVLDAEYPDNLRAVHDRPPLIFVAGDAAAQRPPLRGRRRCAQRIRRGLERAASIAGHLVDSGYAVVSGLAAGIDTAAHTATLAARGCTVAVIGTGLAHSYPLRTRLFSARSSTGARWYRSSGPSAAHPEELPDAQRASCRA